MEDNQVKNRQINGNYAVLVGILLILVGIWGKFGLFGASIFLGSCLIVGGVAAEFTKISARDKANRLQMASEAIAKSIKEKSRE